MGVFEDIGGTLGRGAGRVLGGIFGFRKGGIVPMANGGSLQGIYDNLPGALREARVYGERYLPQVRDYLGLQNGGIVSTPLGKTMVMPSAGSRKPRKKRVQKKKK